jgi:hypothetical protein
MITIYSLMFNEEVMLPYFLKHYQSMFPGCKIVLYDNESTDNSVAIAKAAGCEVRTYYTRGKLDDLTYLEIKNNCWKDADTNWVAVVDVDEHLQITEKDLIREENEGHNVLIFEGFNMVNLQNDLKIDTIETGVRATSYDKLYCFNKKHISAINYSPGCHGASPAGKISFSKRTYVAKHYKYVNLNYMINRHAMFAKRLSDSNKKRGYAVHYSYPPERIKQEFENARLNAQIVL